MSEPVLVRAKDVQDTKWPGGGRGKRLVYPRTAGSRNMIAGVIRVPPSLSPHRWHRHTVDKAEGYFVKYPRGFEEAYIIVRGNGVVLWKKGGRVRRRLLSEGDAVYFPPGIAENQVVNTGKKEMVLVYVGTPIPKVVA